MLQLTTLLKWLYILTVNSKVALGDILGWGAVREGVGEEQYVESFLNGIIQIC